MDRRSSVAWTCAIVAAALLAVLAGLALAVAGHPGASLGDRAAADVFFASDNSRRFELFRIASFAGSAPAVALGGAVLAVACWLLARDRRLALLCLVAPAAAALAEILLKSLVARPAPATDGPVTSFSFPSGHATGASALAVAAITAAFALTSRPMLRLVVVAAAVSYVGVVAVARVVVGAHYATDVVGGALLGVGIALAVLAVLARTPRQEGDRREPS
jgi:membrane-associated phospholipid phosphatase